VGAAVTALIGTVVGAVVPQWSESLSGPPLRFSTSSNAVLDGGESWVLPKPLSPQDERSLDLANPNFLDGLDRFRERLATEYDGVRLGVHFFGEKQFSPLQITVEGRRDDPVLIRDMRARVTSRQPPLSGTLIYGMPQGVDPVVEIAFDLDSLGPVAMSTDESGHPLAPYFATNVVTLGKGEKAVFSIRAYTATCYCEWEIDVYAVVDGRDEKYTIRDGTRPLRTTAWAPSYDVAYSFNFDAGRFERTEACRSGPSDSCLDV
jgi:hypothetical protein